MRILIGYMILSIILGVAGYSSVTDFYNEKVNKSQKTQHQTVAKDDEKLNSKEAEYKEIQEKANSIEKVSVLDKLEPMMTKETFTNQTGMQGWEDYKKLMKDMKLADSKYVKESTGSSLKEVDAFFKDKKGVQRKEMKTNKDGIKQVDYWYVDKTGKKQGKSKTPVFYAEILTKFKDDKLISASVEPGFFTVESDNEIDNKEFENFRTLNDILEVKKPKPIAYSVIQMEYKGNPLTQVSVLTNDPNEKGSNSGPMLAYFVFSPIAYNELKEPVVLNVRGLPFMSASSDFGNSEYGMINEYIKMAEKGQSDRAEEDSSI